MTNDPILGQPDVIVRDGRTFHRTTNYLPLSWADDTSYGKISNAEWLEREAARMKGHGIKVWIHHDTVTDTGALFSNRFYHPVQHD